MKKTISMLAILAAANSASALIGPGGPGQPERKTVCLKTYPTKDKSVYASDCDESYNNKAAGRKILANGCAKAQVAVSVDAGTISSCLPAGVVQL